MSDIRTRPATKEYRDNWSKVFGAKKSKREPRIAGMASTPYGGKDWRKGGDLGDVNSVREATSRDIKRRLKETP